MKISELRKEIKRYNTIAQARKELKEVYNRDEKLNVRCYTSYEDNMISTDLQVEHGENTINVFSIEIEESRYNNDYYQFYEDSCKALATHKKNLIKDLVEHGYKIDNIDNYYL